MATPQSLSIITSDSSVSLQDIQDHEHSNFAQLPYIPFDNQTNQYNTESYDGAAGLATPVSLGVYEPMMMMSDSGLQPDMKVSAESASALLVHSSTQDSLLKSSSTVDERDFETILPPSTVLEGGKSSHELFEITIQPGMIQYLCDEPSYS